MSEHLHLKNQLCHKLYVASNAVIRAYRPYLEKLDITYPQYLVMMALWESDKRDVGQLKTLTQIDGGALSLILKKLNGKGLLTIAVNKNDKRVKIVSLTPLGQQMERLAEKIPASLLCQLPEGSVQEIEVLKGQLDKLLQGLRISLEK